MYLRRLEAHGFKAFADRQRFDFGPGLTVIVGPNGSGKSNVADSIRWALGETSARNVRARKTEDVIFSGSEKRRQMGAAEVSLTLDNAGGWMPIDYGEVTVTRRAFRSGENEYVINGQKVRLADVQDLFRRAQVGQNSYAMMSQGLVDEVLAMRPSDRRDLIEEAANVRRHRQQLTLSERRLVETRDNLGRVRMLLREVEPRIRQLQRQTAKAERYRELTAKLREAQLVYFEEELRAANEGLAAARAAHDEHTTAFEQTSAALRTLDGRLSRVTETAAERRDALEGLVARERQLAGDEMLAAQEIALARQRLELLATRQVELEAEIARLSEVPEADPAAGDELATLLVQIEEARGAVERERESLRSADDAARAILRDVGEAEMRRARLETEQQEINRRVSEIEGRRRKQDAEHDRARQRREQVLVELKDLGRRARELHAEGEADDTSVMHLRERRDASEASLEEQLRQVIEARDALRTAEAHLRQHEERSALLTRLAGSSVLAGEGARALVEAAEGEAARPASERELNGVLGGLISVLRVPDGLDEAIEAALGEQLAAVVVETDGDAARAIEYLRTHEVGTATLFPLDQVQHAYPLNIFNERGVVGVAARLVRCDAQYRPLIDTLLGRTIVVDDLKTAREIVRRGLGAVVTRDGVLLRPGGAWFGGRTGAIAKQFGMRRELEELPAQQEALERGVAEAHERLAALEASTTRAREAVDSARTAIDGFERRRKAHADGTEAVRRRISALSGEMRLVRRALGERQAAGDDGLGEVIERRERLTVELAEVGDRLAAARDRGQAVTAERDRVSERVTAAVTALATAEEAHRLALQQREEREAARRRAVEQLERASERLTAARAEVADLELSARGHEEQRTALANQLALAQAALEPARDTLAAIQREEHALQSERTEAQQRLLAAERAQLEADAGLRAALAQLQRMQEQLAEDGFEVDEHGVVRASVASEPAPAAGDTEDGEQGGLFEDGATLEVAGLASVVPVRGGAAVEVAELREAITKYRAEIRGLGPVNVDAIEELCEERERFDFLSTQVADLEAAEHELRQAIVELRKLISVRFDETFVSVNASFAEYFARFFGGGIAELRLTSSGEDDEEPGVEISAQPPGKRIASLSVLSGGERALTSVALLFALLSVNPAPVVVLDEVDAAMDEANVGRFVDTLKALTDRSQFIVISHNRRTVEAADAIYGVSMGDDSTSQVLSLRLADLPQAS